VFAPNFDENELALSAISCHTELICIGGTTHAFEYQCDNPFLYLKF